MVVLSSGYDICRSADENYPFQVNTNFYYMAGIEQTQTHLVLTKDGETFREWLFIDPYDETYAKWIGHRLTKKEASELSGVPQKYILYRDCFEKTMDDLTAQYDTVYADLEIGKTEHYYSFGLSVRDALQAKGRETQNVYDDIVALRSAKRKEEIALMQTAVDNTRKGVEALMKNAKAGMYEYQLEAYFDHVIKDVGNKKYAFRTIAASGIHATTLHYSENNSLMNDGDLVLFDLGCREQGYCADVTRTFPVNGKFTELQRTIYEIVLSANKRIARVARAGMTLAELQEICVKTLTAGCLKAGLIQKPEEIRKYYFHGVSHSIGLDTHDPIDRSLPLPVGAVISDEPGLYFPEYRIGVRIEDDLVLLRSKAINLSQGIVKEVEDIEAFMAAAR